MTTGPDLAQWRLLGDDERLTVAHAAIGRLGAHSVRLGPPRVETFGPTDDPQRVVLVEAVEHHAHFAFVPGGPFDPGLDETAMSTFWGLQRAMLARLRDRAREHEVPYTALAWSPESLRQRPRVVIAPFFISVQPLGADVLGVEKPRYDACPLLDWSAANSATARLGYDLPTRDELELATTAGSRTLFYWGDGLPEPMDPAHAPPSDYDLWQEQSERFAATYMGLAADVVAPWPTSNRFGLQGAAGKPVWCRGAAGEALVAGGADRFFPWQGCGEWLWLLSALRVDVAQVRNHQGAMVRPVLRVRDDV